MPRFDTYRRIGIKPAPVTLIVVDRASSQKEKSYKKLSVKIIGTMEYRPDRRAFLALTGTSATAGLAGCSSLNPQSQTDGDEGGNPDTAATLAIQVQPDQEELRTLQEELQADLEDEEISQAEAQQELQSKQAELTEKAVIEYEETAADDDAISVDDSEPEYGILRITAPATTFVSALENGDFAAVLPSEYYDQYIQQQEQQQALQEQMEEQENNTTNG